MTTKIDEKLSNAILTGCDLKASKYRVDHFKFPWLPETEIQSRIDIYFQDKRIVEITDEHVRMNHQGFVTKAFASRLKCIFKTACDDLHSIQYGGGITSVSIFSEKDTVEIVVEDGGPGVPKDERFKIFDRFSRGSSAGQRGDDTGSGLGLSMVHEDIRLHGGQVWVEDRNDGKSGARFVIQLPLAEESGSE